jgi:DNA-binding NarL/FixJ family response regulator
MTKNRSNGTTVRTPADRSKAPRVVLATAGAHTPEWERVFRRLGWEVAAAEGEDPRRVAHRLRATAVVLPVEPGTESGLLTCAKLVRELPMCRVVLVGPENEELERFALFAGAAAYVVEGAPGDDLVRAVTGQNVWEN